MTSIQRDVNYAAADGATYALTTKQFPDAALWMTLPRHSPIARITLLSVPPNKDGARLAQELLSEALRLVQKSKARTSVRTRVSVQTAEHFKAARFKKVGDDYLLDLYAPRDI